MWFKVAFNRDGSVSTCEEVEAGTREDGKQVVYVEAMSKADAITLAAGYYRDYKKARRQRAGFNGKCVSCVTRVPDFGYRTCRVCIEKVMARRERKRAGTDKPKVQRTRAAGAMLGIRAEFIRTVMVQTLRAYDADPARFREWLLKRLGELGWEEARELAREQHEPPAIAAES